MGWTAIRFPRLALVLAVGVLVLCRGVAAADATHGVFGIQVENDLFGGNSDRHYTHGLRLSWLSAEGGVPD